MCISADLTNCVPFLRLAPTPLPVRSPMGKKFRSQNEVRVYLERIGSDLDPARFCFNAHGQVGLLARRPRASSSVRVPSHAAKARVAKAIKRARGLTVKPKPWPAAGSDEVHQKIKLKFNFARRRLQPAGGRQPGESRRPLASWARA